MDRFISKIYRFMYGRYGTDQLSRFLMLMGFVMAILCLFLRFLPFKWVGVVYIICSLLNSVFYVVAFFRIFSKNIPKRTLENQRFLMIVNKLIPSYEERAKSARDRRYIYKKCPKCSAKLRLKRVKGKHITKCPKCETKFNVRIFIEYKNPDGFGGFGGQGGGFGGFGSQGQGGFGYR